MAEPEQAIPEAVWKEAERVFTYASLLSINVQQINTVARALLSAELRGRTEQIEADARIAEAAYESRNLADRSPRHIAAAIRSQQP